MVRSGGVAVFLQARIGSSRLPSKALFRLGNATSVAQAMKRLRKVGADSYVLLTDRQSFLPLKKEADLCGFEIMEGPAEDVLKRYALAVEKYTPRTVIRATGDNPLVFADAAEKIVLLHIEKDADHSWLEGMPLGAGVEVVKAEKLLQADEQAKEPYEREHVTPFLYRNPQMFRLNHVSAEKDICFPEGRITLDTMNDYLYLKKIFEQEPSLLTENSPSLVSWLRKNPHPDSVS